MNSNSINFSEDLIPTLTRILLIVSFAVLAFVTLKNIWIIQKMWEFRKWCVERENLENGEDFNSEEQLASDNDELSDDIFR